MTYTLIIINIIVFLLPILGFDEEMIYEFGVNYGPYVVLGDEIYRLFTSMFMHANTMHLVMNMLALYLLGQSVEPLFPKLHYLLLYFISGLFGGLVSIYFHLDTPGLGASGAVFGLFGVLIGFAILHRDYMGAEFKAFIKQIAIILGINLAFGLAVPNVDLSAHIAGLIVGFIGGLVVGKNREYIWIFTLVMLLGMGLYFQYLQELYVDITEVLYEQY
ncbi:MAG: rhomboid family intramembrane serine protease [Campylobacterales bacterium]|nr:rhomboid family intramembrane serine protease [Campylobacterales bacterium]